MLSVLYGVPTRLVSAAGVTGRGRKLRGTESPIGAVMRSIGAPCRALPDLATRSGSARSLPCNVQTYAIHIFTPEET